MENPRIVSYCICALAFLLERSGPLPHCLSHSKQQEQCTSVSILFLPPGMASTARGRGSFHCFMMWLAKLRTFGIHQLHHCICGNAISNYFTVQSYTSLLGKFWLDLLSGDLFTIVARVGGILYCCYLKVQLCKWVATLPFMVVGNSMFTAQHSWYG